MKSVIWIFRKFTCVLPDLDEALEQSVASPVQLDTPDSGALSEFSLSSSSFFCPSLNTAGCKSTPPMFLAAPLVCLASRLHNKLTESSSDEESSLLISQAITVFSHQQSVCGRSRHAQRKQLNSDTYTNLHMTITK